MAPLPSVGSGLTRSINNAFSTIGRVMLVLVVFGAWAMYFLCLSIMLPLLCMA